MLKRAPWPSRCWNRSARSLGKYTDILDLHAEKVRQERLECAGFTVIRWTWDDIWTRSDWVVARLARALGLSNR